jgi:hypothetical protein
MEIQNGSGLSISQQINSNAGKLISGAFSLESVYSQGIGITEISTM